MNTFLLVISGQTARFTAAELNFILANHEKLTMLPDPTIGNQVYRLSLTAETHGKHIPLSCRISTKSFVDVWKIDGFMWKNLKKMDYPMQQPEFSKIYYASLNNEKKTNYRCMKYVYVSKKNNLDVVVHYIGKYSHWNKFHILLSNGDFVRNSLNESFQRKL